MVLATTLQHLGPRRPPQAIPPGAAPAAGVAPLPDPATPIDVGSSRQLFLDQRFLARTGGDVELVMNPPVQHPEPVIVPDRAWEDAGLGAYNTVLREADGRWRMWYDAGLFQPEDTSGLPAFGSRRLCYAESHDGLHWHKPTLDLLPFRTPLLPTLPPPPPPSLDMMGVHRRQLRQQHHRPPQTDAVAPGRLRLPRRARARRRTLQALDQIPSRPGGAGRGRTARAVGHGLS